MDRIDRMKASDERGVLNDELKAGCFSSFSTQHPAFRICLILFILSILVNFLPAGKAPARSVDLNERPLDLRDAGAFDRRRGVALVGDGGLRLVRDREALVRQRGLRFGG